MGVDTLPSVTSGPGRLSVGALMKRWGVTRQGALNRLARGGLLTSEHASKGGYSFTPAEIEAVEADPEWVAGNRQRRREAGGDVTDA